MRRIRRIRRQIRFHPGTRPLSLVGLGLGLLFAVPSPAARVTLSGRVTDAGGGPIAGAEVRLRFARSYYDHVLDSSALPLQERPVLASTQTDESGHYRLEPGEEGVFRVEVSAPGYATAEHSPFPVVGPRTLAPLALPEARPFEVRVLLPGGEPAAGAGVRVGVSRRGGNRITAASPPWALAPVRSATGEDGRARLEVPAGESLEVRAATSGLPAVAETTSGSGDTLRLPEAAPIPVEVQDSRGRPLGNVAIGAYLAAAHAFATTGADGRASLPLPTDARELRGGAVAAPSGAFGNLPPLDEATIASLRRDPESAGPVVVILEEPELVSGRVLERGSYEPVGGALVWSTRDPAGVVRTGSGGGFEIPGGEPLRAAAPGYVFDDSPRFGTERAVQEEAVLFLAPAASLAGRVTDGDARPVAGATLSAVGGTKFRDAPSTVTGEDGRFVLSGLPAAETIVVAARHPDYATTLEEASVPARGEPAAELHLVLGPGATLHGRVADPNGEPIAGATVGLLSVGRGSSAMIPDVFLPERAEQTSVTDEAGRYRFTGEPSRRVRVWAEAPGFASITLPELELEGAVKRNLVLVPGARLEGRVVDGEGEPISGARVQTHPIGPGPGINAPSATSDEDGRFVLDGLPPEAQVRLSAFHPDYAQAREQTVRTPRDEPLVVVLERPARLAGVVLDGAGRPVPSAMLGVMVFESAQNRSGTSHQVGDDGRFDETVAPGRVELRASAPGHPASRPIRLDLAPGESVSGLELVLAAGEADLEGRVVDADGRPIPDATIHLREATPGSMMELTEPSGTRTDLEGRFRLAGLSAGRHSLLLDAEGQPTTLRDVTLGEGPNTVELRFERGWSVDGRVVDGEGLPLPGVHVEARGELRAPGRFPDPPVVSAADGAFSVRGLAAGRYTLSLSRGGAVIESIGPVRVENGPVDLGEIRIASGSALLGRVRGLGPELRPQVEVTVYRIPGASQQASLVAVPLFRWVHLDAEGRFRVEDLPPGRYSVEARLASRGRADHTQVVLDEGLPEARVELDLSPGLRLSGTVVQRGGGGIAEARVRVVGGSATAYTTSDSDGRFHLDGLEPGRYRLSARPPDGIYPHEVEVELEGDLDVTVELERASLAGEVRERGTGAPVAGASVFVTPAGSSHSPPPATRTGPDGSFSVSSLPAGSYSVRAVAEGYAREETVVELEPPGLDGLLLELGDAGRVEMRVRDAAGRRVPRVMIRVRDADGRTLLDDRLETGEDGTLALTTLPPGRHEAFVVSSDGAGALATVEVGGPPVEVTLPAVGGLVVSVPALRDTGTEAELELVSPDGETLRLLWGGREVTRWRVRNGMHSMRGVPAGTWRIHVTTEAGESWSADVVVRAGETSEVVLR